jgi:NAD(P)-dependent dehydrogenase (short-subunit alcohol dehydrogenase family)
MKLENQVAIVTGGASGMGRAIVKRFAREGARVVIADLDAAAGQQVVDEIQEAGGAEPIFDLIDISNEDQVKALVATALKRFGSVDILVNCAGRTAPLDKPTTDLLTYDEWKSVMDVNLMGPWMGIKYCVPVMRSAGGGVIINVASTAGLRPFPGASPYCVSKAALLMLTKTSALEYAGDNIRVTAIVPGHVDTPMMDNVIASIEAAGNADARRQVHEESNPIRRLGRPEEVASIALFLASGESSFVTGSYILADGGYMAG